MTQNCRAWRGTLCCSAHEGLAHLLRAELINYLGMHLSFIGLESLRWLLPASCFMVSPWLLVQWRRHRNVRYNISIYSLRSPQSAIEGKYIDSSPTCPHGSPKAPDCEDNQNPTADRQTRCWTMSQFTHYLLPGAVCHESPISKMSRKINKFSSSVLVDGR